MRKIGFIGAGNMATAIIRSMVSNGYDPGQISIFNRTYDKCSKINPDLDIKNSAKDLAKDCNIIVLAVKPQNYKEVLSEIKTLINEKKAIVSIAAGITAEFIESVVGHKCGVIRVMPNTPLLLSEGATAISDSKGVDAETFDAVKNIFSCASKVEIIPDEKMDEIISVSGSSPAFVYLFAKAVTDYAVSVGIDYDVALNLFTQTLVGSAKMLKDTGTSIDDLIRMVSSPGGTTLAALDELDKKSFYPSIISAMKACTARAKEISKAK